MLRTFLALIIWGIEGAMKKDCLRLAMKTTMHLTWLIIIFMNLSCQCSTPSKTNPENAKREYSMPKVNLSKERFRLHIAIALNKLNLPSGKKNNKNDCKVEDKGVSITVVPEKLVRVKYRKLSHYKYEDVKGVLIKISVVDRKTNKYGPPPPEGKERVMPTSKKGSAHPNPKPGSVNFPNYYKDKDVVPVNIYDYVLTVDNPNIKEPVSRQTQWNLSQKIFQKIANNECSQFKDVRVSWIEPILEFKHDELENEYAKILKKQNMRAGNNETANNDNQKKWSGGALMAGIARFISIILPTAFANILNEQSTQAGNNDTANNDNQKKDSEGALSAGIYRYSSPVWPKGEKLGWHLEEGYTGLKKAFEEIQEEFKKDLNNKRVIIAHLDSGYNPKDPLRPPHMCTGKDCNKNFVSLDARRPKKNGAIDYCNSTDNGIENDDDGIKDHGGTIILLGGHGIKTISTLAGNKVDVRDKHGVSLFTGYIGGNPLAEIREYKINNTNFPVHFFPHEMAIAISCAVDKGADVISISQGGFPSIAQRDAVNHAYRSGVPIFAAAGNFFVNTDGTAKTPHAIGFPARYRTVMGVAGVTANGKSYADDPCASDKDLCRYKDHENWGMRGNYGPKREMEGHVISAYTPNILHSVTPKDGGGALVSLDGAGTSHATPQVAAAASLWLQKYRKQTDKSQFSIVTSWKRTEAVYQALINSAEKNSDKEKFGEGILKADKALEQPFDANSLGEDKNRKSSEIGSTWVFDLLKTIIVTTDSLPKDQTGRKFYFTNLMSMYSAEISQNIATNQLMSEAFENIKCPLKSKSLSEAEKRECIATFAKFVDTVSTSTDVSDKLKADFSNANKELQEGKKSR